MDKNIISIIDRQMDQNKFKNLFCAGALNINEEMEVFISEHRNELVEYIKKAVRSNKLNKIVDYIAERAIQTFYKSNQFINFAEADIDALKKHYFNLFIMLTNSINEITYIFDYHYEFLRKWLCNSNPFVEKINSKNNTYVKPVICKEYSVTLQIHILKLDINNLMEPILDLGCGTDGTLVKYLRSKGLEAYGVDRNISSNEKYFDCVDWFDYDISKKSWGTIISNMSFSNHFIHHHFREDGEFIKYAHFYNKLLNSLNLKGKFVYAPSLPFIETYLPQTKYLIENHRVYKDIFSTIISRIH